MNINYIVKDTKYLYLRDVLKYEFNISSRLLIKLKKMNLILLNSNSTYLDYPVKIGDKIEIFLDFDEDNSNVVSTKLPLSIIYEDEYLLILNKPAGYAIHPSQSHYNSSLSNGIRYYFDSIGLKKKIRIVNRLDKNTSGIVIVAKNEYIQECLIQQMNHNMLKKKYIGIVEGILDKKSGIINVPISRKPNSIIERCVDENGYPSITHYHVLREFCSYSLVSFLLETGRTHQIRVHCNWIEHPILGDTLYGNPSSLISRQALHSYMIDFVHPITKQRMHIKAPIPEDMAILLRIIYVIFIICSNKPKKYYNFGYNYSTFFGLLCK